MQHSFETIRPGMTFGPLEQAADRHALRAFAFSVGNYSAFAGGDKMHESCAAYSAWAAKRLMHLYMLTAFSPQGVKAVHLKEDYEFIAPVKLGALLTMRGQCVDKFVRKGRPMVACESEAVDEAGNVLVRQRSLEIVPLSDGSKPEDVAGIQSATHLSDRRVAGKFMSAPSIAALDEYCGGAAVLRSLSKEIRQDQIGVFCGAEEGWQNLHTSVQIARDAGFDRPLMSGLIHSCWFVELLAGFFGSDIARGLRLGSTYLRPVQAGAAVSCHAQIVSADKERFEVELWNEVGGEVVATGFALVPRS